MHSKIPHDPYKTLGIPRDATLSLIRNARRKLILEHHPDRNPETEKQACLAKFLAIEEAYKVLSDPAQRKEYDQQTNSGEAYRIRRFSEETSRKATEYLYMGSQEFRSRKSTNSFTRSGTIPSNTRSRGNREAVTRERPRIGIVYDATCNVSSDSESDSSSYSDPRTSSVSAARRGRQQSQGLYSTAPYGQNRARESSVQSRVSSRNRSLGGGRHFERDYQEPEFARRRSGSGSDYEIRRSSPGLPPRPSQRPHRGKAGRQSQTRPSSSFQVEGSNAPPTQSKSRKRQKQHICRFCKSQFYSKNAAESHECAMHNDQRLYSCDALKDYHYAFALFDRDNQMSIHKFFDVCLFCGKHFLASERDWDQYKYHVITNHKLGMCKLLKELYKPFHFRQHLINSHAARIGWWTYRLEALCAQQQDFGEDKPIEATITVKPPKIPSKTNKSFQDVHDGSIKCKYDGYNQSRAPRYKTFNIVKSRPTQVYDQSRAPRYETFNIVKSRPTQVTPVDPRLSPLPRADGVIQEDSNQLPALVKAKYESIDVVEQPPELQKCYICNETITLTGKRTWQIHVFEDLRPYQCLEKMCPQADSTYASLRELKKHYVNLHTSAEILPASCPFCSEDISEEISSSSLHARFKHVGRHMEDIAFAVVAHQYEDWKFYSESSTGSEENLHET